MIIVGMAAMEFLGLLTLAGLSALGLGHGPWVLSQGAALPVAFAIGFITTYALGRTLGVIGFNEIDTYRSRVDTMHDMARAGRRIRRVPRATRRVVIEY